MKNVLDYMTPEQHLALRVYVRTHGTFWAEWLDCDWMTETYRSVPERHWPYLQQIRNRHRPSLVLALTAEQILATSPDWQSCDLHAGLERVRMPTNPADYTGEEKTCAECGHTYR